MTYVQNSTCETADLDYHLNEIPTDTRQNTVDRENQNIDHQPTVSRDPH